MKVSVAIPLYNKADYIRRALEGVFAQTLTDYEVVIVDDGSTDGSAEIVQWLNDPRVRLLSQPNAGEGVTRDRAIRAAHGDYIALLDADDEWAPDYLACAVRLLDDYPHAAAGGVGYALHNPDDAIIPAKMSGIGPLPWRGILPDFFQCALADPPLWSSSTTIRRQAIETLSITPSHAKIGADQYLFCQLAAHYPIAYDSTVLSFYRADAAGRVLNTYRYDGELPFVTLVKELLAQGALAQFDSTAIAAYVAKYQLETIYRLLPLADQRALVRQLLRECQPPPGMRRLWAKHWLEAYLPPAFVAGLYALWRFAKGSTGRASAGAR